MDISGSGSLPYGVSENSLTDFSNSRNFCSFFEPQKPFFTDGIKYKHFVDFVTSCPVEQRAQIFSISSLSPTSSSSSLSASSSTNSLPSVEGEKKPLKGKVTLVRTNSRGRRDSKAIEKCKDVKNKNFHQSFNNESNRRKSLYCHSKTEYFQLIAEEKKKNVEFSYKFSKDYENSLEEEFFNKICYSKNEQQESTFFGEKTTSGEKEDQRLTIREAVTGYPFVMTTKNFLEVLLFKVLVQSEQGKFAKEVEGMTDEEKKKKERLLCKYLMIFTEWVKNCSFFEPDINDKDTYAVIEELFSVFRMKYGNKILKSECADIEYIRNFANIEKIEMSNKKIVSDFDSFIDLFKHNPEELALELFASSIHIQSYLNSSIADKNKYEIVKHKIGEANDRLQQMIVKDIFTDCKEEKDCKLQTKKKIHKKSIENRKEKVRFYIKLAELSKKYGDFFTCLALYSVFNSEKFKNELEFALNPSKKEFIAQFSSSFWSDTGLQEKSEILKKLPVPVFFPTLFNECESSKEKYSPRIDSVDKETINANYVKKMSQIIFDLVSRQKKTQNIKSQTNFSDLLLF